MCGAGRYLCGGRLRPCGGFHLEVPPKILATWLYVWMIMVSSWFHWAGLGVGSGVEGMGVVLPCHAGVGWADGVGARDWERCHSTCGHRLWWTPPGPWIMYTVGLSDGWCNNAKQNSVTRNPSDGRRLNQPTSRHTYTQTHKPTTEERAMYLACSLFLEGLSGPAVKEWNRSAGL